MTLAGFAANAATLYVATNGTDSGDCTDRAKPCRSITYGIAAMSGGDTLIIGDGTYAESIKDMPSGSAGAYTTIRAANDWGVLIDGSGFPNTFQFGISIGSKSYVAVRGFRIKMNQANGNNEPVIVVSSDHVKIQRCSGGYAPTDGNAATFDVGPDASYVLIEECFAYGGGRYQFIAYQSDHVLVRRSVARVDHWTGTLQCAGFVNYNSTVTTWQNNIALDSDNTYCSGGLYGGFFSENKSDVSTPTSQALRGNIVLNVNAFYAGDLDWVISGTRDISDMVIWGSSGGYWGDQGPGDACNLTATRFTVGAISGDYDGPNGGAARGTGVSIYGPIQNTVRNSIFTRNQSLGVADYTNSDYNAFYGNGANYGGAHKAVAGAHDRSDDVISTSLRYLPRIETGSPLKTAGEGGGQIGAEIMYKVGVTGTLYGETGWDQLTADPLWPFPNEDQIRADMAAYSGPGATGARGFASGKSLDGTDQTLTKYIWEYLGNQIPSDIYGFHIGVGSLPVGTLGVAYDFALNAVGGTPVYTWSVTAGSLPTGLSLDNTSGTITGTPTAVGSSSFTITASDATGKSTSTAFTLVINAVGATDATTSTTTTTNTSTSTRTGTSANTSTATGADTVGGQTASPAKDSGCGCQLPRATRFPWSAVTIVALTMWTVVSRRRKSRHSPS